MDTVLLLVRVFLAGTFGLAAITKLVDPAGSKDAMRAFGLPERLAGPAAIALPLTELAVASLLLPQATAWWGALGALALLLTFIVGIGVNLAQGRTPDCHCFGQLHSAPAGWPTLGRNGALASAAALVLWQGKDGPGPSMVARAGALSTAETVAVGGSLFSLALIVTLGWLVIQLLQQSGRLLIRIEALEAAGSSGGQSNGPIQSPTDTPKAGLPVGTLAPAFSLPGLNGEIRTLDGLRKNGNPVVLIFTDPGCGPCGALLPELGRWQREHAHALTLALISRGSVAANRPKVTEHGIGTVLLQHDREVSQAYQSLPTPSAVLVRPDGTIGAPAALGSGAIRELVARTVGTPVPAPTIPLRPAPVNGAARNPHGGVPIGVAASAQAPVPTRIGDSAPALLLPDLNGDSVNLKSFSGERVLVLFWNPGCGFCARMLDELLAWEANPPVGAARLLVISTGSVEANKDMGLRGPVLLDQGFVTGRAFGASGTPAAVLVDADGTIASKPAVGGPEVRTLAGRNGVQARAT